MNYQKIKLNGGAEVFIDLDNRRVKCKSCDTMLYFGLTKNNKQMPIEQKDDGSFESHFANCEKAAEFRKSVVANRIYQEDINQDLINSL